MSANATVCADVWCVGRYNYISDTQCAQDTPQGSCAPFPTSPGADGPYSDYDLSIIEEILKLAEASTKADYCRGKSSAVITLVKLLKAYEAVLPRHSIVPEEDIYYYRILLKLSLDPNPDWWAKFSKECLINAR